MLFKKKSKHQATKAVLKKFFRQAAITLTVAIVVMVIILQVKNMLYLRRLDNEFMRRSLIYYEASELLAELTPKNTKLLLVDVRPRKEYEFGHIKTAVNIPSYSIDKNNEVKKTAPAKMLQLFDRFHRGQQLVVVYGTFPESVHTLNSASLFLRLGVPVKVLNVSFYQFKNFHYEWLEEQRWPNFSVEKYVKLDLPTSPQLPVNPQPPQIP